jgi:probable phosphoglycerate mutase
MSILIARHGETDDNSKRIIQLPTSPLSIDGIEQAKQLAQRLKDMNITRIIASDYERARQTALLAGELSGVVVEFNDMLREQSFGDLRGRAYGDLDSNPFASNYQPPNGESWSVFCERVASAWLDISEAAKDMEGNLLIVTHGFVCKALLENHLTLPNALKANSSYGNTALTQVDAQPPWTVQLLNCTAHLAY